MDQRTIAQNRALHKGCAEIADTLVEHGIPLRTALENLDTRPTMESIKDIYRDIAYAKFGVRSTKELTTKQVGEVWEDLTATLSRNTGVHFHFPSAEWQFNEV